MVLILALLATVCVVREMAYFFAPSMQTTQTSLDGSEFPINTLGHGFTYGYRYDRMEDWEELIAWVGEHDDGQGRWLVMHWTLGEYLMARTDAQILGGFLFRNLEHSDANWFRRNGGPPYRAEDLQRYFETYAVGWVLVPRAGRHQWWQQQPHLITEVAVVDEMTIYRVNAEPSLIAGEGSARARINRVKVRGSRPDEDLVLRFHWLETLRCRPDCEVLREEIEGDRVGFMRIPAPHPSDFEIVNAYMFP